MPGPYPVVMSNGIGGWHSKYMVKGPGVVTGRSGTIGSLHYIEQNFWPHNTSLWVTSFNGNEPRFIYWLYASIGVERFGSGSGVPTLNRNDVHDLRVGFPCDVAEQRRIGTFFSCLDGLITLHQRKCQYRGLYGYLSWEQRKLGEVATRHDNLRIPITAKDRIPGDTPYYGANGIQDYVEGYTHEGEFVLVAEDGATDLDNYPVQLISGLSWVNNHAHVIKAIPDVAQNRFIMYLIKSMDIASYLVGGTRSKLNAEVLMGIELKLPSNSEQIYIGALLGTLDSLITLHQ